MEDVAPKWGDLLENKATGEVIKYFCPNEPQQALLNSKARFIAALGGKNSGKSAVGALFLFNEIQRLDPQGIYLVCGPEYHTLIDATVPAWEKTVKGTPLEGKFVGGNSPYYRLGTGGTVFFRSAGASIEGIKPLLCWIDESGDCPEQLFIDVQGRLLHNNGRCIMTSSPYLTHDWLQSNIMANCDKGDANYYYRVMATYLNPSQPKEAIEQFKATRTAWEYEMFIEGKFTCIPNLVFNFQDCYGEAAEFSKITPAAYIGAVDWGGNDPTAVLCGCLDTNDVLWVWWEHYKIGAKSNEAGGEDIVQTIEKIISFNKSMKATNGATVDVWWMDHRPDAIRAIKRLSTEAGQRLRCKAACKGAGSISLGIDLVRARARTGRLRILRKQCPNLCKESLLYRYATQDGQPIGKNPLDKSNHSLDALRYMILGLDKKAARIIRKDPAYILS